MIDVSNDNAVVESLCRCVALQETTMEQCVGMIALVMNEQVAIEEEPFSEARQNSLNEGFLIESS